MSPTFDTCVNRLGIHEGGFSDNPRDPGNWTGGKVGVGVLRGTKYGVAANTYPTLDIRNLTWDQAKVIYKREYWDKSRAQELQPMLRHLHFDAAVNSGVGQAVRWLQRSAKVADDGVFGMVTLNAVSCTDPDILVLRALSERQHFMTRLSNWPDASRGWARRIADLMKYAAGDRG